MLTFFKQIFKQTKDRFRNLCPFLQPAEQSEDWLLCERRVTSFFISVGNFDVHVRVMIWMTA